MRVFRLPIFRHGILPALMIVATARCGSDSPDPVAPGQPPGGCTSAADLATCLPSWQSFSPKQADADPSLDGSPASRETMHDYEHVDDTGKTVTLANVTYTCTDSTFKFVDNPDRALSFGIDETKIWPGALIQGKTHRDGKALADVQELPIRQRAPLTVTMSFNNQDNTRTVENPEQGSVHQAIGSMIGNAQAESLATANHIDYSSESYSSEQQAARAFGVSARYLGFEAHATGSVSRSETRSVVVAKFMQQMYVAGVTQPASPSAVFSGAFTPEVYAQYATQMGAANPPLYVSRIGYGRMMIFSMSATASTSEIKGALTAAYNGVGGGGGGGAKLSARDSTILQDAQIRFTQIGGDAGNALKAIHDGDLAAYFTNTAPLTSAEPLWFELKTLTGEVAYVSEPGTYTQTTCAPKLPGTFNFGNEQTLSIPFTTGTQRQTITADVDGDGRMDVVFNERQTSPAINRVYVATGNADGTLTIHPAVDNPNNPAEGWQNYSLLAGDIDGDGYDDLVWNTLGTNNAVYTAMSTGTGSFTFRDRQEHVNHGWSGYHVTTGDLNGDGKTDLLWNNAGSAEVLRTYFGLAKSDGTFAMSSGPVDRPGGYTGYDPPITANFDGVGGDDFVVNALGATFNNSYVGLFTPTSDTTGTLQFPSPLSYNSNGWAGYTLRVGDVDGTHGADLVFVNPTTGAIHRSIANGNGTFVIQTPQLGDTLIEPFLADFNDDGRADLLEIHREDAVNELSVGFGLANGTFTFPSGKQTNPRTPAGGWLTFQILVGDVNGDQRADIVFVSSSSSARYYVALAN